METAKHQYTLEPLSGKMVRWDGEKKITFEDDQAAEAEARKAQDIARDQNGVVFNPDQGLTRREYAAIHLRLPDSGNQWLDAMITAGSTNELAQVIAARALAPSQVIPSGPTTPAPSSAELYIGLKAIVNAFAAKEDEPPRPLGTEAEAEAVKAAQILVRWYEKHTPTS